MSEKKQLKIWSKQLTECSATSRDLTNQRGQGEKWSEQFLQLKIMEPMTIFAMGSSMGFAFGFLVALIVTQRS